MRFEDGNYLKSEKEAMTNDEGFSFDIKGLFQSAQNVLDTYAQNLKNNHDMEKQKELTLAQICNVSENICNSIPDSVKTFKKDNKPKEELFSDLSNKIDQINQQATFSTMLVNKMINNLDESKKQMEHISTNLDGFVKLYKEGIITAKKDFIREINNLKETLDIKQADILNLKKTYFRDYEKSIKLKIPESSKDFISPKNLEQNIHGLYLPQRLKTYMEVKNDFINNYDSSNLHKEFSVFEQMIKNRIKLKEDPTSSEKIRLHFEIEKFGKIKPDLIFNIDAKVVLNYILTEKTLNLLDTLEYDTMPKKCFYQQTKGLEKQYEEMRHNLNEITKYLKDDDRQLNILRKKVKAISIYPEKEVETPQNQTIKKATYTDRLNASVIKKDRQPSMLAMNV